MSDRDTIRDEGRKRKARADDKFVLALREVIIVYFILPTYSI